MTEAERNAKKRYLAKGKRLTINFYPTELELYAHLEKQPNKQGYIKNLIREDLQQEASRENLRKHLIELLNESIDPEPDDPYVGVDINYEEAAALPLLADYLIANGATLRLSHKNTKKEQP